MQDAAILVVEDDADLREILESDLREIGYEVLTAANGYAALEVLRFRKVDVILSDLNMPELGGVQLLKAVRSSGFQLPFVVLSAYGTRAEAIELMRLGVFDFLEKPVSFEILKKTLDQAVALSRKIILVKAELMKSMGPAEGNLSASNDEALNSLAAMKAMRTTLGS